MEELMSTNPHDEERTHNESPAEGDTNVDPGAGQERPQQPAEGEDEDPQGT